MTDIAEAFAESDFQRAYNLLNMGEINKAVKVIDTLSKSLPQHPRTLHLRGLRASAEQGAAAAIAWLRAATRCHADADIWHDLGHMLAVTNQVSAAFDAYGRAAALAPASIDSLLEMASILRQSGRESEALPFYQIALNNAADDYRAHLGMATTLHFLRDTDGAEPFYRSALSLSEEQPEVCWEYAMQCLLLGDFEQGWRHYDARLAKPPEQTSIYPFAQPLWQGEALAGKTLLIHGEQGFGDEIMFASIVPELIQEAATVIIATAPALYDLFKSSFPDATVYALPRDAAAAATWHNQQVTPKWLAKHRKIDFQTPIGSLARWRRSDLGQFPGASAKAQAYIRPDPAKSGKFAEFLEQKLAVQHADSGILKVGLVWQGNLQTGLMGQRKSIPLSAFAPLATIPGVRFVSLQLADAEQQIKAVAALRILPCGDQLQSFSDTAALIANLDLVISVDTGVAHLAAAMGKETWVLLWRAADWRYLLDAEQSHWYPSMQIFRQKSEGKWSDVITQVQQRLSNYTRAHN